ncbi:unnamed protein product [Natator depressus]
MSCQKLKNRFLQSLRVFGGTEGPAAEDPERVKDLPPKCCRRPGVLLGKGGIQTNAFSKQTMLSPQHAPLQNVCHPGGILIHHVVWKPAAGHTQTKSATEEMLLKNAGHENELNMMKSPVPLGCQSVVI